MSILEHDITHCNADNCSLKDTCYRYQAHLDAIEKNMDYLCYFIINEKFKVGKDCKSYWKIENK